MKKLLILLILFIQLQTSIFAQYNFYYGNIHSHSDYSDGNQDGATTGSHTPADDYKYARASNHMDFLGISEHNHFSSPNNPGTYVADFTLGLYQADTSNRNGTFVTMYGMEWGTISSGGHLIVYGIPGLVGWETLTTPPGPNYNIYCAKGNYTALWSIINGYSKGFCTLAHPQSGDFGSLLNGAAFSTPADNAIVGTAVRSGGAFSTTTNYSDAPATLYTSTYYTALAKGYHLGPTIDHDNHNTTFGRTNDSRTVVMATALNRDSIYSAYRAMRFYASDDWNVKVTYTLNGNFMGSIFNTTANSAISLSVTDADAGDNVSKIEIYYGIPGSNFLPTLLTSNANSSTLNFTHPTVAGNNFYYFAKIVQTDGDSIWTSPIWITRTAAPLPIELLTFEGAQSKNTIALRWVTAFEGNNKFFEIEKLDAQKNYQTIGKRNSIASNGSQQNVYNFDDLNPTRGTNFYRLQQTDTDGRTTYSEIIAVQYEQKSFEILALQPNPTSDFLKFKYNSDTTQILTLKIYSSDGREVFQENISSVKGEGTYASDIRQLPAGTYFLSISKPDERVAEAKFVKN